MYIFFSMFLCCLVVFFRYACTANCCSQRHLTIEDFGTGMVAKKTAASKHISMQQQHTFYVGSIDKEKKYQNWTNFCRLWGKMGILYSSFFLCSIYVLCFMFSFLCVFNGQTRTGKLHVQRQTMKVSLLFLSLNIKCTLCFQRTT